MNAYLMAQGSGLRWKDDARFSDRFKLEAPDAKHRLEINGEQNIIRSVRLFEEAGFDPLVISTQKLLFFTGLQPYGYTLYETGPDIIHGVLEVMRLFPPDDITAIVLADVIFSRKAINDLVEAINDQPWGCMARVEPSTVCSKVADEVFLIWFTPELWYSDVSVRLEKMIAKEGYRPSKPWAFPFAVSPDLERALHEQMSGKGLSSMRDDLLVTDDYTDDIDSPEEWLQFWDDIRAAAEADV